MHGHRSGGKISKTHSSVIPAAVKLVDAAEKCPEVTNIRLSKITSGKSGGQYRLKITQVSGGLRALVRGPTSLQEIFIYTKSPERTQKTLEESFGR